MNNLRFISAFIICCTFLQVSGAAQQYRDAHQSPASEHTAVDIADDYAAQMAAIEAEIGSHIRRLTDLEQRPMPAAYDDSNLQEKVMSLNLEVSRLHQTLPLQAPDTQKLTAQFDGLNAQVNPSGEDNLPKRICLLDGRLSTLESLLAASLADLYLRVPRNAALKAYARSRDGGYIETENMSDEEVRNNVRRQLENETLQDELYDQATVMKRLAALETHVFHPQATAATHSASVNDGPPTPLFTVRHVQTTNASDDDRDSNNSDHASRPATPPSPTAGSGDKDQGAPAAPAAPQPDQQPANPNAQQAAAPDLGDDQVQPVAPVVAAQQAAAPAPQPVASNSYLTRRKIIGAVTATTVVVGFAAWYATCTERGKAFTQTSKNSAVSLVRGAGQSAQKASATGLGLLTSVASVFGFKRAAAQPTEPEKPATPTLFNNTSANQPTTPAAPADIVAAATFAAPITQAPAPAVEPLSAPTTQPTTTPTAA